MHSRSVLSFDVYIIAATLSLIAIGILFIYSSGVTSTGRVYSSEYIRQLVWAGTGLVLLVAAALTSYTTIRSASVPFYILVILLLLITLAFGRVVNGARSWLGIAGLGIQPSEFAKLASVLVLAIYLERVGTGIRKLPLFLAGSVIMLIPMGLTLVQPDLGTALVFMPLFLIMAFVAGARLRHVSYVVLVFALTAVLSVIPAWERQIYEGSVPVVSVLTRPEVLTMVTAALAAMLAVTSVGYIATKRRYFFWITYALSVILVGLLGSVVVRRVLAEYQMMRLIVFLDPYADPRGAGWNIIQSITAVGSGGFSGKGFLQGTQSHYQFIPQQSTDFIFSILAEEWGFLGGLLVFGLFLVILLRGLYIVQTARDNYSSLVATGIVALVFFHFAVNVGMVIGVMPITGIPLFFLSHGGSSLWTAMAGVGLLLNIHHNRYHY
ncbi:MAG: rod shape-determining protein RodA [Spirochaetes bacterium]|nr:rod shape-determining protein RodA [Spirochaetota bacterium]